MSKIVSISQALDLIQDNHTIATSGFMLAGTPQTIFRTLGERYTETKHPANLTCVFCASQGDYVNAGYDHWAQEGMIGTIIGGHFGGTYKLADYMAANKCQAYNFPMGVMAALFRNAVQKKPFELTKIGLGTFVDPRVEGGRVNSVTTKDLVKYVQFEGEDWLCYPTPHFDIGIIRGTTSDEDGNISLEDEIAEMEIRSIAMAVKACGGKVIVQVRQVSKGTMTADRTKIPTTFVDAVVVCPNPEVEHRQTKLNFYIPEHSSHINIPLDAIPPMSLDTRKVMARRAAMQLRSNAVINLGIGVPEGVASVAAEEGFGEQITLTSESGALGGFPQGGFAFGAPLNALGILDMRTMFDFYDGNGLYLTVLGLAEVNAIGDINVSRFGPRVPGCGGFINLSQSTNNIVFCGNFTSGGAEIKVGNGRLTIVKEGKTKKFVKKVDQITYSGQYGASIGQNALYVTERAVFRLSADGLVLTEIAPGIDLQKDVLDQMEFMPIIADDLRLMDERLFREEKMGLSI